MESTYKTVDWQALVDEAEPPNPEFISYTFGRKVFYQRHDDGVYADE